MANTRTTIARIMIHTVTRAITTPNIHIGRGEGDTSLKKEFPDPGHSGRGELRLTLTAEVVFSVVSKMVIGRLLSINSTPSFGELLRLHRRLGSTLDSGDMAQLSNNGAWCKAFDRTPRWNRSKRSSVWPPMGV